MKPHHKILLAFFIVLGALAPLAPLLLWVKKPAPTIPPHQVHATLSNSVLIVKGVTGYVEGVCIEGTIHFPGGRFFPPENRALISFYNSALTNGQLLRYVVDGTNASIEIVRQQAIDPLVPLAVNAAFEAAAVAAYECAKRGGTTNDLFLLIRAFTESRLDLAEDVFNRLRPLGTRP